MGEKFAGEMWISGDLAQARPPASPEQSSLPDGPVQADTGDTIFTCCSRFVCFTTQCGTGPMC